MRKVIIFFVIMLNSLSMLAQGLLPKDELDKRLAVDFTKTEADVKAFIQQYIPDVTAKQMATWEKSGALECRIINGEKRYFRNAARNLFRIEPDCQRIYEAKEGALHEGYWDVDAVNVPLIMRNAASSANRLAEPKHMRVTYTLTVNPDAVPAGKTIRCWLPFPRKDIKRQTDVKLLKASERNYQLSGNRSAHSSLYMERKAVAGKPTVFSETFEYTSNGEWQNPQPWEIKPYDTSTALYKEYTAERAPHMIFTPRLRQLADSLTAGIDNPLEKARAIFTWVDKSFPWASAIEYSTIDNIPEYVVNNRHGDCGQVTLLFLTLCRIVGIPSHFQSGFMMHPENDNLHDWGEIYFEGIGWVPVDMSFGIPVYAKDKATTYFFLGGIDSWRMVVNQDWGMPFFPAKKYPRSETVDFQRGEVEWEGGNLYFNQWNWNIKISY